MSIYAREVRTIGSSSFPNAISGTASHNFERTYYQSGSTGSVRATYQDLKFTSTGEGEAYRARAIVTAAGSAAAGTVNAAHFTGRVDSATATISGALNAVRATLEVAGTSPAPGGTLAALQLDTNISTGWTEPTASFIRVTNSNTGIIHNLLSLPTLGTGLMVAAHTAQTNTHSIKILVGGVQYYIPIHATASGLS